MPGRTSVVGEVSRRDVLGWGAAAAAISALSVPACASAIAGAADVRVFPKIAMVDMDLAAPQSYFAAVTHHAQRTIAFRGDIASQWYGQLDRALDSRAAVIGLTTAGSLFCFEELCAHRGFKLLAAMRPDTSGSASQPRAASVGNDRMGTEEAFRIADLVRGISQVSLAGSPLARFAKVDRTIPVAWVIAPAALDRNRMATATTGRL